MKRIVFVFDLLLLIPNLLPAQTIAARSNPLFVEVSQDKTYRTNLVFQDVKVEDANNNLTIEASEKAFIHFNIINRSQTISQRLYVSTSLAEPLPGLRLPELIQLHPIPPGKTQEVSVSLQAYSDLPSGVAVVSISVREADVFEADQIEINILTSGATISAGNYKRRK